MIDRSCEAKNLVSSSLLNRSWSAINKHPVRYYIQTKCFMKQGMPSILIILPFFPNESHRNTLLNLKKCRQLNYSESNVMLFGSYTSSGNVMLCPIPVRCPHGSEHTRDHHRPQVHVLAPFFSSCCNPYQERRALEKAWKLAVPHFTFGIRATSHYPFPRNCSNRNSN